jgi:hypothetical protein
MLPKKSICFVGFVDSIRRTSCGALDKAAALAKKKFEILGAACCAVVLHVRFWGQLCELSRPEPVIFIA